MTDTVRSRPVLVTLMALSLVLSPLLGTGALSAAAKEPPEDKSPAADDSDAASSPDEDGTAQSGQRDQSDRDNAGKGSGDASGQGAGNGESGGAEAGEASESSAGEDQSGASSGRGAGDEDSGAGNGSGAESEQAAEAESSEGAEGRDRSEDASSPQQDEAADENPEEAEEGSEPAEEAQQRDDDPPHGNVGSVKVAPVGGAATPPGTEPHIEGCAFDILIYGRGHPDSVTVDISAQPPTGGAHLRTVTVALDGDAPAPGNEPSGRATVDLESQLREMAEAGELDEHDQQGFHLKLYVNTPEGGAKQKVFWLDCPLPDEEGDGTAPGEPDEEDEQEQDEDEQEEDAAPEDDQLEGELMVAKEVTGDAPSEPFEFVIECDDDEWTRTVAAGEAGEPVTVDLDADERSTSCTVTEAETHGADEVAVDGEEIADDPQVTVEVDAGESVETVFVNAFDDEDVAPGAEPPADGEGPAGETPADGEGPAEEAPAGDAPAGDAPAEGGSAEPPAEEEPSEVAPSDEVPGDVPSEDAPEEVAAEDAPTDRPLFEAVAPEEAQREQAAPEQTEREHVAAGSADVQQVTAADETRELAATGLSLPAQLTVALVAIGAGATLLTVTSVRGRAWGTRAGGSLK